MDGAQILDVGTSSLQGDRSHQEDRHRALKLGTLSHKNIAFFAVYDGHAGSTAVDHITSNLHHHLDTSLHDRHYKDALREALASEDDDLLRRDADGGATVALALIDTARAQLISANLGDSHSILIERSDSHHPSGSHRWYATRLSEVHKPSDPRERERIEAANGMVNSDFGDVRVGEINVSRTLGDLDYKNPILNEAIDRASNSGVEVRTPVRRNQHAKHDLISHVPHTTAHVLRGRSLLLLATDGIGYAREAEEAAHDAADLWDRGKSAREIATILTKRPTRESGSDNCTVVVVFLEGPGGSGESGSQSRPARWKERATHSMQNLHIR